MRAPEDYFDKFRYGRHWIVQKTYLCFEGDDLISEIEYTIDGWDVVRFHGPECLSFKRPLLKIYRYLDAVDGREKGQFI